MSPTSYDRSRDVLFTSVHAWLVRDDAGLVMLVDTCLAKSGRLMGHEANDRAIADSVMPVIDANLADFADPDAGIAKDMCLIPCYGHSPGMLLVEISGEPGANSCVFDRVVRRQPLSRA